MPTSKTIWIHVISVILIASIFGGTIYLWQKSQQQITLLENQITQLQEETTEKPTTTDKTETDTDDYISSNSFPKNWFYIPDWQKYSNNQYPFEVKFPAEWQIDKTEKINWFSWNVNPIARFEIKDPNSPYNKQEFYSISTITIYDNENELSLDEWITQSGIYVTTGEGVYEKSREENKNSAGQPGIEVLEGGPNGIQATSFYLQKDNSIYRIGFFTATDLTHTGIFAQYSKIAERITRTFTTSN